MLKNFTVTLKIEPEGVDATTDGCSKYTNTESFRFDLIEKQTMLGKTSI